MCVIDVWSTDLAINLPLAIKSLGVGGVTVVNVEVQADEQNQSDEE